MLQAFNKLLRHLLENTELELNGKVRRLLMAPSCEPRAAHLARQNCCEGDSR
jgi:hypothetical protein